MKKAYTFGSIQPTGASKVSSYAVPEEDEDHEDPLVGKFFAKKTTQLKRPARDEIEDNASSSNDDDERARSTTSAPPTKFLKHIRPKPDLGDNGDDDIESSIRRGEVVHLAAKAPAKELPYHIKKSQERWRVVADEEQRKKILQQQRKDNQGAEKRKREESRFWMQEYLQDAKRALNDGGPSGKLILRKDYLEETAGPHTTGKNLYHNQFVAQPGLFYAGKFFIEPQGSKPPELNTDGMVLYIFVEKTGPDGFLLRVERKYYELFEGDIGIVPAGALYSLVNPSKSQSCVVTYTLVREAVEMPEQDDAEEQQDLEDEVNADNVLDYKVNWGGKKSTNAE